MSRAIYKEKNQTQIDGHAREIPDYQYSSKKLRLSKTREVSQT